METWASGILFPVLFCADLARKFIKRYNVPRRATGQVGKQKLRKNDDLGRRIIIGLKI